MNRLTRIGFIVAIGGGLLALAPSQADAYVLVKILALAAGGVLLWAGLLHSGAPLRRTVLDLPLAALWGVMILAAFASADPPASVFGMYRQGFYGLLPLSLCAALYFAAAQVSSGSDKDDVLRWLVAASIPLAAYGISQRIFGDTALGTTLPGDRIVSTLGGPSCSPRASSPLLPLAAARDADPGERLGPGRGHSDRPRARDDVDAQRLAQRRPRRRALSPAHRPPARRPPRRGGSPCSPPRFCSSSCAAPCTKASATRGTSSWRSPRSRRRPTIRCSAGVPTPS